MYRSIVASLFAAVFLMNIFSTARASDAAATSFPGRQSVTMLVGFAPGGSVDSVARIIAQKLGAAGWNVVVENRTGASGLIAMEQLARSKPDGYTLMMGSVGNLAILPSAMHRNKLDPLRDFTPVAEVGSAPLVFLVPPDSPIHSIKDVIDMARKSQAPLNYASGGVATPPHLAAALLGSMAKIKLNHIPYRGEAPAIVDLIGKHVPMMFANISAALPQIKSGAVRAVAVTSPARSPSLPDVPTMAQSGLPGFDVENWYGIVAPAHTPPPVVARIHDAVASALAQPDVQKMFQDQGFTIPHMSSQQFGKYMADELARWRGVVQKMGISIN